MLWIFDLVTTRVSYKDETGFLALSVVFFLATPKKSRIKITRIKIEEHKTKMRRLLLLIKGNKEAKYRASLCLLMRFGVLDVFTPILVKALVVLLVLIGVLCLDLSVTN
ncbi:hypothetical protein LXL04_033546 [Taraxacum kok-saghyz]